MPAIAAAALPSALSAAAGAGADIRSPAVLARSAAVLDQKCFAFVQTEG